MYFVYAYMNKMKRLYTLIVVALQCVAANANPTLNTDSLEQVAQNIKDPVALFDIYYLLGSLTDDYDLDKSIRYTLKAKEIARKNQLTDEYAKAYLQLALTYQNAGRLDEALDAANQALHIAKKDNNKLYQYYAHRNIAAVHRREADFDSALYHYLECSRIAERVNDTLLSSSYTGLGAYFATIDELDKAEEYHNKALALRLKYDGKRDIANSYNNLGIISRERGDYKKALSFYYKSRDIYIFLDDSSDIAFIYNDIGAAYSKMGLVDSGAYYLKKSIAIREHIHELIELAYTYNYLGENYEREGDLKLAEQYIKRALNLAIEIKNNKQHYQAYESLSDFFARNSMYDSAYKYLQLYRFFRDSIRRLDNEKVIADLHTRYETEKKEKKIQEQQFELARKNYMLYGGIILFLSVGLLSYSAYRRYKLRQQTALQQAVMKQQELATKAVLEAEENERQRIASDLHDGVGQMMSAAKINLSTVAGDVNFSDEEHKQRFENALKLVDDSCKEVRNVSHTIMPNALLRNSLAAAVRTFVSKIDERVIKINLHTEGLNEKLDENIENMLYRVIQECVSNVIKHAAANTLDISLTKDEHEVSLTVEDNGKGFVKNDKVAEGIGMKNIRSRVNYLKGSVEWDSRPGKGTVVMIHVPLK